MRVLELKEKYDEYISSHDMNIYSFPVKEFVIIKNYIPVVQKLDIVQKAVSEVYTEIDGIRSYDQNVSNIVRDLTVVSLYTDLEYTEEETFEAYDILVETGIIDYLYENNKDCDVFINMYGDTLYNVVDDYNSVEAVLNRGLLRLENRLVGAIDNFANKASINPEEVEKLKESLLNINSTMDRVKDVKSADIVEAYKNEN